MFPASTFIPTSHQQHTGNYVPIYTVVARHQMQPFTSSYIAACK
jgi:hypothetical protein